MHPLAQTDPLPDLLHRLDTRRRDMTPWEAMFVDAVRRRLRAGGVCTVRQRHVLATMAQHYLSPEAAPAKEARHYDPIP